MKTKIDRLLTENDKEKIRLAIEKAEALSHGQIVPLIVSQSDFYPATHFRMAAMLSFLGPFLLITFSPWAKTLSIFYLQAIGFMVGYLLTFIPVLKRQLITKSERAEEVHQRALQGFFQHGLVNTKERTGLLIMISLLERRVEIVADWGIQSRFPQEVWQGEINQLISAIRSGELVSGLCQTIENCGHQLSKEFPPISGKNELKDDLILE